MSQPQRPTIDTGRLSTHVFDYSPPLPYGFVKKNALSSEIPVETVRKIKVELKQCPQRGEVSEFYTRLGKKYGLHAHVIRKIRFGHLYPEVKI